MSEIAGGMMAYQLNTLKDKAFSYTGSVATGTDIHYDAGSKATVSGSAVFRIADPLFQIRDSARRIAY
jgi:hypothetical protein